MNAPRLSLWLGLGLLLLPPARAVGPLTQAPWGEPLWAGSAAELGRGGAGLALLDSSRLSLSNPALFHSGRLTRFMTGFGLTRSRVEAGGLSELMSAGHFDSQALGVPLLWQDLHAGFILNPLTSMDYLQAERQTDSAGREYVSSLKGGGGLSRAGLVFSRAWGGRLRTGLDLGVVFGSVLEEWKHFYPESAPPYDSWVEQRRSLLGFQPKFGLHWLARPGLGLGLTFTLPTQGDLTVDVENPGNGVDDEVLSQRVDLPGEAALGLAWRRGGLDWLLDLRMQDWSDVPLGLTNLPAQAREDRPLGLALGVELPALADFNAPWPRRVSWRAGLRREEWYTRQEVAAGRWADLSTLMVTLGAGVPLKAGGTWLDLALEAGRTGSGESGALQEDFVRLRLGLSARDLWFLRPTY